MFAESMQLTLFWMNVLGNYFLASHWLTEFKGLLSVMDLAAWWQENLKISTTPKKKVPIQSLIVAAIKYDYYYHYSQSTRGKPLGVDFWAFTIHLQLAVICTTMQTDISLWRAICNDLKNCKMLLSR
jgi:hypothetical protein